VLELDINYLNHWDMVTIYIEEVVKRAQRGRPENWDNEAEEYFDAFMKYIKQEDVETCLNILFVLTNSEPDKLSQLMTSLGVEKREIIEMMANVLMLAINDHKESIKYFHRTYNYKFGYFNKPLLNYIDHANVQHMMKPPSPVSRQSWQRSRSPSYRHHNRDHHRSP
jgi:hypothetical protein